MLKTPKWNWVENVTYDNVCYEHGEGGDAYRKAQQNMQSSVCGHTHTKAGVQFYVGKCYKVFGMQIGLVSYGQWVITDDIKRLYNE